MRIQAQTVNTITGAIIKSNIIEIQLAIPDALNGTKFIDDINTLPSGLVPYILDASNNDTILPLGWKLKSGITLASALNAVTYVDINYLPELSMTFTILTSGTS